MRILYIHQLFSTPSGAVGTRSYEMARRFVAAGHEVTMVCGSYANASTGLTGDFVNGSRSGLVDGFKVIEFAIDVGNRQSLPVRALAFFKFVSRTLRPVLREEYDLVFATSTPLTVGINGIVAKWFRRKKFVFEVRDLWPELPKAMGVVTNPLILGGMSLLEWMSYRACDAAVGLAPGIVEGIQRKAPNGRRVILAPNSCDFEIFSPDIVKPMLIPNVSSDDIVGIFSGTHGPANGLHHILNAAAKLKEMDDPIAAKIKLVFVGDGKQKDQLVKQAQLDELDNCIFLDPVPKGTLAGYLQRADFGIMALDNVPAFYYGTSPNKFFDYLAAELPVVCNYPGWVSDMITENECGISCQPEEPIMLADTMIAMASADRSSMKVNAKKLAHRDFDRDKIADRLIGLFESVFRSNDKN